MFVFIGCKNSIQPIVKTADYEKYMHIVSPDSMHSLQRIKADMDFWMQRLEKNPDDVVAKVSLAGLHGARFKVAGDINDIHTSDSLYLVANPLFKTNSSSLYRSLATNCVTQHKFQQAQLYLDTVLTMGDDIYLTYLMRCDVAMELGNLYMAEQSLNHIVDKNNFDYLIREAKLLDHRGDLDGAVKKMEAATEKAIESKKDVLFLWAKSNLADMYGHANKYKESYQCYLDVLEKKPDYLYALKGIAWLAFSHDKNPAEAKRILNYLSGLHPIPDYDLLLSKIAAYEKDKTAEKELENRFLTEVSDSRYGDMYNKYVFYLMTDEERDLNKALQIAEREVTNRPTSQSYDLLAWANYKIGKKDEALKIAKAYVENKSYEPDALYHLGLIYAEAGNDKKAKQFMQQAENAAFELGPGLASQVSYDLKSIKN
ncbi:MAG TPA: tetratricopeptide repeat protein [Chitinophagaceae bacterium]|nr:tetratricopeptide repeat protein [Chitinophagaceae bacterium]